MPGEVRGLAEQDLEVSVPTMMLYTHSDICFHRGMLGELSVPPYKTTCAAFAVASFAALLTLLTVEPITERLRWSAVCFSTVIGPFTIQAASRWPDRTQLPNLWLIYGWGFVVCLVLFAGGILLLVSHFGLGAAVALSVSVVFLALGAFIQWQNRKNGK
jgi:hypothetical protein